MYADDIRIEDIPEEHRDLVDVLGMDSFLKLVEFCSGQALYVPKLESLQRGARDRLIRSMFNGGNYRQLAIQFRLSERQVRKIVKGER